MKSLYEFFLVLDTRIRIVAIVRNDDYLEPGVIIVQGENAKIKRKSVVGAAKVQQQDRVHHQVPIPNANSKIA